MLDLVPALYTLFPLSVLAHLARRNWRQMLKANEKYNRGANRSRPNVA